MAERQVIVKIKRQVNPQGAPYWEEFALTWRPAMNAIICLRDIAGNPVTRDGKKTTPVSYDSNCLEEVCGSCPVRIKGKALITCAALLGKLGKTFPLEPMSQFPAAPVPPCYRQFTFGGFKTTK